MTGRPWTFPSFRRPRPSSIRNPRCRLRPRLEALEDRLAPAVVSLVNDALTFTASTTAQAIITVTAPSANTLDIAITGDTISLGSGTTGSNFQLSNNEHFLAN